MSKQCQVCGKIYQKGNLVPRGIGNRVTRRTIISLEKGSYIPSLLLAMDIADVLNVKIENLFFKEER